MGDYDYEKAEIIFHSKNTESLNEGTNIVLIYLKDKNPHAVTNAVAKLSSSPYIVYQNRIILKKCILSQMIFIQSALGNSKNQCTTCMGLYNW